MISVDEVLLSIIITGVIMIAVLYYYSAKIHSLDVEIQISNSNRELDLITQENMYKKILEIQGGTQDTQDKTK